MAAHDSPVAIWRLCGSSAPALFSAIDGNDNQHRQRLMTKLKAPSGTSSASYAGIPFEPGMDGSFEVPEDVARVLIESHGFTPWAAAAEPKDVRSMSHSELVLHVLDMTRKTLEALPTEELRQRLLAVSPGTVIMPDETAKGLGINPDTVLPSDLEKMTRTELFAFLKARGLIGKPEHTREDLLRTAIKALRGE